MAEYETGEPLRVDLLRKHTLIGAASGAGKTTLLNALLRTLGPTPDVLVWAVDFAGGAGLAPWRACLGRLATTPAEAQALLTDAVAAIDARERWLADHGEEHWQPTPVAPAIVVPVDELAELIEQVPDAAGLLDTIARARPLGWKFTSADLDDLLPWIDQHQQQTASPTTRRPHDQPRRTYWRRP